MFQCVLFQGMALMNNHVLSRHVLKQMHVTVFLEFDALNVRSTGKLHY